MHAIRLLEKWFKRNCEFMHVKRARALMKVVDGLLRGESATLTELGRSLFTQAYEKHNIKCVDRLLGNEKLWSERVGIYKVIAGWLLGSVKRPWILIDWSDVEIGHRYLMLKAAVSVGGRAISIYEEVHPLKRYANPKVEREFLERLGEVIPPDSQPIIITDAGFRGPWFRSVEEMGWDWIGRVRNMLKCQAVAGGKWKDVRKWYRQATGKPKYLGRYRLSKQHPYECWLHLYKAKAKRATAKRRPGKSATAADEASAVRTVTTRHRPRSLAHPRQPTRPSWSSRHITARDQCRSFVTEALSPRCSLPRADTLR